VNRRHALMLAVLSAVWGATYLLIKIGLRDFSPGVILWARFGIGALAVAPLALVRVGAGETVRLLRQMWAPLLVLAALVMVMPTLAVAWAEQRLDSSLTAVIQASTPLFTALLSPLLARHDTVTGSRLVGLILGFAGVGLVVGVQPHGDAFAGVVVASTGITLALSAILSARWLAGVPPLATTFGMLTLGAFVLLPLLVVEAPQHAPGADALLATLGLGAGTGTGFLLYYAIIAGAGATYVVLMNYLVPAIAVVYGAILLGESIGASSIVGLALVLLGVALGGGALRRRRVATPA
jgi:drug/metabolite transporter (DMT)-like permease